jgi:hypothetical protein
MNKIIGAVSVLCMAIAMMFAQSAPASADVVVNNVLSPFTMIQVGPGHRVYRPQTSWAHNPRHHQHHHQRCYREWDRHTGGWSINCVRIRYGGSRPYYD